MNAELQKLLNKYGAEFEYSDGTWCIYNNPSGKENYYESDDYEADTLAEAEQQAIDYLTAYHEED